MSSNDTSIAIKKDTHAMMTRMMGKESYDSYLRKLLKLAKKYRKELELVADC